MHLAAISPHNLPYACRGENVTFECQVTYGASLQWASEPHIPRSWPLSYIASNEPGETRRRGSYQSYLLSVTPSPPISNFSSNLTFTPSSSVTVVCGDQIASCSTEEEYTLVITGKSMLILFLLNC